jgi:hypothetical protein
MLTLPSSLLSLWIFHQTHTHLSARSVSLYRCQQSNSHSAFTTQVNWGEPDASKKSRYNDVYAYLPRRIVQSMLDGDPEFWKDQVLAAHQKFGKDKKGNWFTDLRAMTMYLTLTKQFPQVLSLPSILCCGVHQFALCAATGLRVPFIRARVGS